MLNSPQGQLRKTLWNFSLLMRKLLLMLSCIVKDHNEVNHSVSSVRLNTFQFVSIPGIFSVHVKTMNSTQCLYCTGHHLSGYCNPSPKILTLYMGTRPIRTNLINLRGLQM